MLDRRDVIYLYDGSFAGFLSAVFDCTDDHIYPYAFEVTHNSQQSIFCEYRHCVTSLKKAEKVTQTVISHSDIDVYDKVYEAFCADVKNKGLDLFEFIRLSLRFGTDVVNMLSNESVNNVINASYSATHEAHMYTGFVRFCELENGVFYGRIEPKNDVLTLMLNHFVERFSSMPFIIHDVKRGKCLVYNGREAQIRYTDMVPEMKFSEEEMRYQDMWKQFYKSIEIKERHNDRCRMAHMPKRMWKFITEMNG